MRDVLSRSLGDLPPLTPVTTGPGSGVAAIVPPPGPTGAPSSAGAGRRAAGEWLTRRGWAWIAGAWTVIALLSTQQTYVALAVAGRALSWGRLFVAHVPGAILWMLLTPVVVELTRRNAARGRWARAVPIHVAGIAAATALDALLYQAIGAQVLPNPPVPLLLAFVRYLNINITNYLGVVAVTLLTRNAALLQERQLASATLASQLTVAHLRVLQSQLRPHFLFNTLNTLAELVHRDADAADRMITRLGVLLRRSFDANEEQEVPLRTEMEFLQDYVDIMRLRFGGRIAIVVEVDAGAEGALVPSLVLQPLVENAIRHGLEPQVGRGTVTVSARRHGATLALEVRDDGYGLPAPLPDGTRSWRMGVGLQNTADRLRHLYGDAHRFDIRSRPGAGTTVAIELPFRCGPTAGRDG